MREEEQCQDDTIQFFFYYIFICGDPKMGYNNLNQRVNL
jgi:hypothetical protein